MERVAEKERMDAAMGLVKLKRKYIEFEHEERSPSLSSAGTETETVIDPTEDDVETDEEPSTPEHRELNPDLIPQSRFKKLLSTRFDKETAEKLEKEARAAYLLMQLHVADQIQADREKDAHRDKRRRASS